jgi:hypothetical protein
MKLKEKKLITYLINNRYNVFETKNNDIYFVINGFYNAKIDITWLSTKSNFLSYKGPGDNGWDLSSHNPLRDTFNLVDKNNIPFIEGWADNIDLDSNEDVNYYLDYLKLNVISMPQSILTTLQIKNK